MRIGSLKPLGSKVILLVTFSPPPTDIWPWCGSESLPQHVEYIESEFVSTLTAWEAEVIPVLHICVKYHFGLPARCLFKDGNLSY